MASETNAAVRLSNMGSARLGTKPNHCHGYRCLQEEVNPSCRLGPEPGRASMTRASRGMVIVNTRRYSKPE